MRSLLRRFAPPWLKRLRHAFYVVSNATYNVDGLSTVHDADFLHDPHFLEAYQLGKATGSWGLSELPWRVYTACWAARHALHLEGDFVECGVNKGGISRAVVHYTNFGDLKERSFYLLDTFCGFPEVALSSAATANRDDYAECFKEVQRTFGSFSNVVLVRGEIPQTLHHVPSQKIAYLSIDLNMAAPEIAALEFFWDKLVPGAMVVLDDYAYGAPYHPQKHAINAFAAKRNVQVLTLPTGQGLIVKP